MTDKTVTDYAQKMSELKMLSMLCACLHVNLEPDNELRTYKFAGMQVKDLNKCKMGQAFEVIIKQPAAGENGGVVASPLKVISPSKKRDLSLDEINGKLDKAAERRKSQQFAVVNQAKQEEEKVLKAKQKKAEADEAFVSAVYEHLRAKYELYEENHLAKIRSKVEKYKEMNMKPEILRDKVRREVEDMCTQWEEHIQTRMDTSEKIRKAQIQQKMEKLKEMEERAQKVRQKKITHKDGAGEPEDGVCEVDTEEAVVAH